MKATPDTSRLRELKAQLHDIEAMIERLQSDRQATREEIAREQERMQQDRARVAEAFEMNVIAQWDSGRSVSQIATALGCSSAKVNKTLAEWRQREGVTVRRGAPMRERRMTR